LSRKEKSRYDIAIKESIANRSAETMGFPHVENPIRVYLAGNDDCSYSRVFPTVDAAKEALQQIIEIPMWETLESFGFVFTN
jgi:hypothetical protein